MFDRPRYTVSMFEQKLVTGTTLIVVPGATSADGDTEMS